MNILADISRKRVTSLVMTTSQNLPTFHDKTIEKDYKSAYQEILKNIWEQDPNDVDYARKVLSWVIFTKDLSSLKLPLLQGALSLENSENGMALTKDYNNEIAEQDLLSVCRGLVTIDHESRNIRFVHYTAEIYFASAGIQRDFFPYAQKQLARTCLKCLLSDDRDNHSLYDHPLYHYASRHWGHHAQAVEEEIQKQIEGFFGHSESVVNSFRLVVDALPFDWKPRSLRESEQTCLNPLHVAAYFGLKLTATNLLENGIDLEVADCRGWTPMRWAIIGATDEMVDLLFKHKASIISTDVQEQQTVFWAVGSRVSERLTHYWLSGNCKAILGEVIALKSEESFATALPSAVTPRTSPSVVKFLLSNIPSVDVRRTIDGRTLLSVVAENWQWDGVKILLGRGANVNLEDENGMTPLLWALQPPRFKTISEFIVVTDGVRLSIGDSSNIEASTELNIDNSYVPEKTIEPVICQLIGCNLEARDEEGKTALSLAAENKFHKVLGCLLENGAEPNTFDCSQMTPLHYACSLPCFRTFVIKVLECRGSDRVRLGAAKLPGLPLAKVQRPLAVQPVERSVNLLLQHGSRRDYKNCRGLTALALAILDGLDSAAALLRGPNTRRASLALGFNDERPGGNHTPKDNIQEHINDQDLKDRQRRDYTKLLLAMLERRARFHIDCARTYGTSMLLVSSTSDILNLQTSDTSQVLIADKSNLAQVSASDASVVIVRDAAIIDRLLTGGASRAFIQGLSQISYVLGSGSSTLTIEAGSKISSLAFHGRCSITTRGNSEVREIRGSGDSRLTIEADSKISSLAIDGQCLITARGNSEVKEIRGSGDARLTIEADSKISSLAIDGRCSITARGNSEVREIRGSGDARLTIEADSRISSLAIDGQCLITARGNSEVKEIRGSGDARLTIEADSKISSLAIDGQCLITARGNSEVKEIRGSGDARLTIEADSKVSSLVINGQCSIIAKGHASISRVNGWGSSSLSLQANTSIDSMVLYGRCLLLSRGNSKIWTTKGYDSSILAIINNIQHQPTFFEIHDKAICFRPCEPDPYLPGDTSNVDNDTVDLPTPSSRNSLSESEALAILKEILAKRGYDNIFSRLDMETELPSLGYGDEYSEKGRGSDAEESSNGNKNMSDDEREGEEKNQDVAISIEKEDWGWVKELL
jgi:ankyrin repeat protein